MPILFLLCLIALPTPALPYIGPGPGLTMLGSLLTLIGGLFLAFSMVIIYPLRLWLKKRRDKK